MIINGFPRTAMGASRKQLWVHNPTELMRVVEEGNGQRSVFVSHNSYPNPDHPVEHEGPCPPISKIKYVLVTQQFYDLDSEKLSNALHEARKVVEWYLGEELPFTLAFSGKKGFQINLLFKPKIYDITEQVMIDVDTPMSWRAYYTAVYTFLKTKLKLRTLDFNCAEPKRVHRVWNTMHFSRGAAKPTGTYCVPMSPDQLIDSLPADILDWASKPRSITPWWNPEPTLSFDEFLDKYQIRPSILRFDDPEFGPGLITEFKEGKGKNWELMKTIIPKILLNNEVAIKLCYLHEMYHNHNPPHLIRFGSCAYWKRLADDPRSQIRFDAQWVEDFYKSMEYDDVGEPGSEEEKERRANIRSIWNRGARSTRSWLPIYEEPSCKKLFATGVCKGPKCKLFEVFLSDVKDRFIKDEHGNWLFIKEIKNV